MRIRRPSPLLLLLLLSSLADADLDSARSGRLPNREAVAQADAALSNDEILRLSRAPGAAVGRAKGVAKPDAGAVPENTYTAKATPSSRPYVGTEDAPVDGLDGKPHAGPFVDTLPETTRVGGAAAPAMTGASAKARPTSLQRMGGAAAEIPEKNDGVMNDEHRVAPKKGTTGTEGGISEKEKERRIQPAREKVPQEPKEQPPWPQSEQDRIREDQARRMQDSAAALTKEGKAEPAGPEGAEAPKQKGEYGYGLERPTDLPEKPHNLPHPDPKGASLPKDDGPPPVRSEKASWLQDTMPYTEGSTNPRKPAVAAGGTALAAAPGEMEWHEWVHSFVLSFTMILFSEIGDKTFLVAALMAMRHARLLVFSAAFAALIAMTVLSAVLGHAVPTLLPKRVTTLAAALLFLVFGARMLREGLAMPRDLGVGEEMREVEAELEEKEHLARRASRHRSSSSAAAAAAAASPYALEAGRGRSASKLPSIEPSPPASRSPSPGGPRQRLAGLQNLLGLVLSPAWVQTFVMTFLGEWGDRSQIATIAMAAGQDYWWVTLGAISGHACCTGVAVIGGRALAGRVSMRVGESSLHSLCVRWGGGFLWRGMAC